MTQRMSNARFFGRAAQDPPKVEIPLYLELIQAGFPSPADDFLDRALDLNEYLISNPPATFMVRVCGDSMIGAGIRDGDILVVDRSLEPAPGKIVVAVLNGELTVKRLVRRGRSLFLAPENPDYEPIPVHEDLDFLVWGVVEAVVRKLR